MWEEGYLTTYVDGNEVMTQMWSQNGVPEPAGNMIMGETLSGAFSVFDKQVMPVTISGAESWPLEIEYLNIWQVK